jgi:hypothetical protein
LKLLQLPGKLLALLKTQLGNPVVEKIANSRVLIGQAVKIASVFALFFPARRSDYLLAMVGNPECTSSSYLKKRKLKQNGTARPTTKLSKGIRNPKLTPYPKPDWLPYLTMRLHQHPTN